MDNCNELLEKFYKSTNNKNFKLHSDWDLRKTSYHKLETIFGTYDNGNYCIMNIETVVKLIEKNRLENCKYKPLDILEYNCEVKKN
jgi:hypothetical protein